MPNVNDFPAIGRVIAVEDGTILFSPKETNYELRLATTQKLDVAANQRIEGLIRVRGRKAYSVPSGGNFIAPIFGTPRIIQGRVRHVEGNQIVVQAGTSVIVELPAATDAIDLANGAIAVGSLVNVVALPGASFEPTGVLAAR